MTSIIGILPARGGSIGIPGKNIKMLAGKPMLAWSIEAALQSQSLEHVIVSTDDEEIAKIARQHGVEVPFLRPPELASDTASSLEVVLHALEWLHLHRHAHPEFVLLLQPTSPLRSADDIRRAVKLQREKNADAVVSVCPAPHPPHWYRQIAPSGVLIHSAEGPTRRQEGESFYQLNGAIYLIRVETLLQTRTFMPNPTQALVMPVARSVDVDTPFDFCMADLLLRARAEGQPCQ